MLEKKMASRYGKWLSAWVAVLVLFVSMGVPYPSVAHAATTLTVYPAPAGVTLNTYYTVKVRANGGAWQTLDAYLMQVNGYSTGASSFVYFDTDGPVDISITDNSEAIASAQVRPSSAAIAPAVSGNTATFTIAGPTKLSVVINGDVNNTVDIFANPLEVNPPSPTDPNVIYLGPGLYTQDYVVPSGTTLYLAGGAVVKGSINMDNTTNAKLIGRGVIDRPLYTGISADYSNQVTIDGVILNGYGYANNGGCGIALGSATNATVNNFKAYSHKKWTDGIDLYSASNISINDIFMRTGDDSIAIYGTRFNAGMTWAGNLSSNISITNSILLPDVAHPINIGTHGDPSAPGCGDTIDNLHVANIDILGNFNNVPISLTSSDGNLVTNASFTDIRIEGNYPRIIDVITFKNAGFSTAPGRGINNAYFKNISYTGTYGTSQIYGQDSSRITQNVTFENLNINGTVVTSASAGSFNVGGNTQNINFIAAGGTVSAPTAIPPFTFVNLAQGKSAAADSSQAANPVAGGNDGSTTTRWCANNGSTGHYWTVDLGSNMSITGGTQVMWEKSGVAYQYKIETSSDNTNWTLQVDKTANTNTDQIQNDMFYDVARYVRITVTGLAPGAWASFYEFKVLGEANNLALGKSAIADSSLSAAPAANASDGNAASLWSASDTATGHWWLVDLGANQTIAYGTQVMLPSGGAAYKYKVETSADNVNWTLKADKTVNTNTDQVQNDYFTAAARYVRITVTGLPSGASAGFYDVKVFGDLNDIALNKSASADSAQTANPAARGNDGSTATAWVANDSGTGHWWLVDLGTIASITNGTQIMWPTRDYYKYKIETSTDNATWTVRVDKTGNNRIDQVQSDYFTGIARYVRITVTGLPSGVSAGINDFKVFGDASNLGLYRTVTSSSSHEGDGWGTAKLNDGQKNSVSGAMGWSSESSLTTNHTESVTIDTGAVQAIGKVDLYPRNDGTLTGQGFPVDFTIQVSTDNTNWTTVVTQTSYSLPGNSVQSFSFASQSARYVKVTGTNLRPNSNESNNYRMQFAEMVIN